MLSITLKKPLHSLLSLGQLAVRMYLTALRGVGGEALGHPWSPQEISAGDPVIHFLGHLWGLGASGRPSHQSKWGLKATAPAPGWERRTKAPFLGGRF